GVQRDGEAREKPPYHLDDGSQGLRRKDESQEDHYSREAQKGRPAPDREGLSHQETHGHTSQKQNHQIIKPFPQGEHHRPPKRGAVPDHHEGGLAEVDGSSRRQRAGRDTHGYHPEGFAQRERDTNARPNHQSPAHGLKEHVHQG